jgi:hypothetical protein
LRTAKFATIAIALLALCACAKPLPPDKMSYAGYWKGTDMELLITPGGRIKYQRRNGTAVTSIEGPITEFEGNDFEVGIAGLTTKFVVSVPPHEVGGQRVMTVDGVELICIEGEETEEFAVEST